MKKLPSGIQTFRKIIEGNYLYVDKTKEIHELLLHGGNYFFLSRPRRFGKSLLISTLEEIFLGNKELFKDLYIYDKIDFKKYPVIKISMNGLVYNKNTKEFELSLLEQIRKIYEKYNIRVTIDNHKIAFNNLIYELSKISEQGKVVLLIDEYDKPIIEYLDNMPLAKEMRDILKNFYETIKANDEYIEFAILTGVSKFSKTSIFSSLNNLNDITLNKKYSQIVGITEEQVYSYFDDRIKDLSIKLQITEEKLKNDIRKWYNGYSWDGINFLYNPYSLLLMFDNQEIKNYWFKTGTPTFLIKQIKDYNIDIKTLNKVTLSEEDFESYEIDEMNVYALLFQTGYLTIKETTNNEDYDKEYVLSYPNNEFRDSFLKYLLNDMSEHHVGTRISINNLIKSIRKNDLEDFFNILKSIFASIPNQIYPEKGNTIDNKEYYYHTIFHIIFTLIGVKINSEISVSKGFIDSVIETNDKVYVFEFKLEKNTNIALEQIENKSYYQKYVSSKKEIYLIGVSFDIDDRNIKDWKYKTVN